MPNSFGNSTFCHMESLKLTNIMENAIGTAIGLCFFVISLYILGSIIHFMTGDRYFAPSIHKMKKQNENEKEVLYP